LLTGLRKQQDVLLAALNSLSHKYQLVGTCPSSSSSSSRRSSSAPDTCARKVSNASAGGGVGVARAGPGSVSERRRPSIDVHANPSSSSSLATSSSSPRCDAEFLLSATSTAVSDEQLWLVDDSRYFKSEEGVGGGPGYYYPSPSLVDSSSASATLDWSVDELVDFDSSPYPYDSAASACSAYGYSSHSWGIPPSSPFATSPIGIVLT
jgi:hypothetical protein